MRADARRNRARLLAAADAVFDARGVAASTEEVAKEAGVGIGTLFRHFPTKEALLEAVFQARMEATAEQAERLMAAPDAEAAFREFFLWTVAQSRQKNAYAEALAASGVDVDGAAASAKVRMRAALEAILTRAQQAGAVRADVVSDDLIALLIGAARATEHAAAAEAADPEAGARTARVILDGLRA